MPLSDVLVVATLEDFMKATMSLLIASTAARKHEDATKKWKIANKGTVDDVRDPTKRCKKTGLIFLLQQMSICLKTPDMGPLFMPALPRSDCGSGTTRGL
jgi:hypothetical protein